MHNINILILKVCVINVIVMSFLGGGGGGILVYYLSKFGKIKNILKILYNIFYTNYI